MRYKDSISFFRHLKNASPDHLCRCYLIIVPDAFERKKIQNKMLTFFSSKELNIEKYDSNRPFQEKDLNACSLFSDQSLVIIEDFDNRCLSKHFFSKLSWGYFLFFSSSKSQLAGVDQIIENHGVVFDLSLEKPWEKKERLEKQMIQLAKKEGVKFSKDALTAFFNRLHAEPSLLEQELKKLILYVGDKKEINLQDIMKICAVNYEVSIWQVAEKIVWEEKRPFYAHFDSSLYFPLISALRHQLQFGFKLSTFLTAKTPMLQIQKEFPKIWPKTLEKKKQIAQKLGLSFFQQALCHLYDIELLSKDKIHNYHLLLDYFISKLYL